MMVFNQMDKLSISRRMESIEMTWDDLLYVLGADESEMNAVFDMIKLVQKLSKVPIRIHQLPVEILVKTTNYLDSLDALKLSSCSKQLLPLRQHVFGNRRKLVLKAPVESIPRFIKDYTAAVDIIECYDENTFKQHYKWLKTFSNIRQLSIFYSKIFDLELLIKFIHVKKLHLKILEIKDLSAISKFKDLQDLGIEYMSDINPSDISNTLDGSVFRNLANLRRLSIKNMIVPNTPVFSHLIQLQELELTRTGFGGMANVSLLVNLVKLNITERLFLGDIKELKNLKKLKTLQIKKSPFSGGEALVHLTSLVRLEITGCGTSNISFLSSLPSLNWLTLSENHISNITPLQSLTNLEYLDLSVNGIEHVSVLSNLIKLKTLRLGENKVRDISCLQNLVELTELKVDSNYVFNFSPLARLTKLEILDCSKNDNQDCSALAGLVRLRQLYIFGNLLTCIEPLQNLRNLHTLHANNNEFHDISPLSQMVELKELYLYGNHIWNVSALSGLVKLETLHIDCNSIDDITPFSRMISLRDLNIANNDIHCLLPLVGLPNLRTLEYRDNTLFDLNPLDILKQRNVQFIVSIC